MTSRAPSLAVVVPTLNEAHHLPLLLGDLSGIRLPSEIVVADGGSTDGSPSIAERLGARVVVAGRGRGTQMRRGADAATAPWLFFVHADCRLPPSALDALEAFVTADRRNCHAHFAFALEGAGSYWRFIEVGVRIRERLAGLVYGDQGLLVTRAAYDRVGGHPDWPIMEDVGVLDRLRPISREIRLPATLPTSPRRYREEGRIRTWLRHGALMALFRVGVPPTTLARWRQPPRPAAPGARPYARGRRKVLVVFAKAPRPGEVKTRLAADVGADEAARIYRAMGRTVVDGVRGGDYRVQVHHAPPDARDEMEAWLGSDGVSFHPQSSGDLGARMAAALEAALADADAACIIGTDAPTVGAETVGEAFAALERHDAVLGPARDGGYYLIGLRRPCPALFRDIAWSGPDVRESTLNIARKQGLSVYLLGLESDVDRLADVPPHLLSLS